MRTDIKHLRRDDLDVFVAENAALLLEDEALAVLENPNVTSQILGKIAQTPRVTGYHSVRVRLVAHRQTPQAHAVKLVHYLYWIDLLNLSVDVQVPAQVRRAIDTLLVNKRLREDDLLALIASRRATRDQLLMVAEDMRWSYRYAIRKALVLNPDTPRAAAASQLPHLSRRDLRSIHSNPAVSVYVKRCIERLQPLLFSASPEVIDYNSGPDA